VVNEFLIFGGFWMTASLTKLFNSAWTQSKIPAEWSRGIVVPIHKGGPRESTSNYRGITVLSNVGKLFAAVLERRLSSWCEAKGVFGQAQAGFRRHRSTVDHIFVLAEVIKRRKQQRRPTYVGFLDIKRAYDNVWREGLWRKMRELGIASKFIQVTKSLYDRVLSCVRVNEQYSEWFEVGVGLRQGCVLSPLLFLIFINDLIAELKEKKVGVQVCGVFLNGLFFADDIALMAESPEHLQSLLDTAVEFSKRWKLAFNIQKCKIVIFNRRDDTKLCNWTMDGAKVEVVAQYKYLGVLFHESCNWSAHKDWVLKKVKKKISMVIGFGATRLLNVTTCCRLWEVLVRPSLEYSAEVWAMGQWPEAECLQREMGKRILNVSSRMANEVVNGELGWWDLSSRRAKARLKMLKRFHDMDGEEWCRTLAMHPGSQWRRITRMDMKLLKLEDWMMKSSSSYEWRNALTRRMQALEEHRWKERMETKSKLRLYRSMKQELRMEPYLQISDGQIRSLIAKLRGGTSFLQVERGRWSGSQVEDRKCKWCAVLEDESHFLLDCRMFEWPREDLMRRLPAPITSLPREEFLRWILGGFMGCDGPVWEMLRGYFYRIIKLRRDLCSLEAKRN